MIPGLGASEFETLTRRVRDAHGDAWQAEGRVRTPFGGASAEMPGARLMASGLPFAKWNNADITSVDVDDSELERWYRARDVPWGVRVPLDINYELGEPLFIKRCTGLEPRTFAPLPAPDGVSIRRALAADLDAYADVELAAFGGDRETELRWLAPAFGAGGFGHWLAELEGRPIASLAAVHTDDRAGRATYLSGLCVPMANDGAQIARALVSVVAADAFDHGADLVHYNPDERDAAMLAPVGFIEVPGFLVRVVRAS